LDSYNNHYLYKFEYYCRKKNIVTFYISLHLSHLFQPLNIECFNILKRLYNKEIENFIQSHINYITKLDFFICFYIIFFIIFNEKNIQAGFRGIGFVRFNPDAVISKFNIKLYIPTPTGPSSAEIDSWVFKIL